MIRSLLTGGKHGSAFKHFIETNYPEIDCSISKSSEESKSLIGAVDGLAGFNFLPPMNLKHIKWIHSFGAGIDSFLQHQLPHELIMTKTTGGMGHRIAEYCLTYILQDLQKVNHFKELQQGKIWQQSYLPNLSEATVYIFGTGFIGQAIAKLLFPLTKKVIGINTDGTAKECFSECIALEQLNAFNFKEKSVIINALPLTDKTNSLIGQKVISEMKACLLINIGRGATVNEASIIKGIEEGNIRHAVLDVFEQEPLPQTHPFWTNSNITITPHISGITTFEDITDSFDKAYSSIKSNNDIPYRVDLNKAY